MKKFKLMIAAVILGPIVIGCSNKDQLALSANWSQDITNDAFIEFVNQIDRATNIANEEEFFFDDVNSEVKITGTDRVLLVSKEYLNMSSVSLPETLAIQWFAQRQSRKSSFISSLIRWVTRKRNTDSDILFEGKDIHVERSLIVDIKEAIASVSKEIAQSVLDAKTTSENFSFAITFHHFDNGYWTSLTEKDGDKFNERKPVKVRGTEGDYLFAFRSDLSAPVAELPDRIQMIQGRIKGVSDRFQAAISLRKNLRSGKSATLQVGAELLMLPKSVTEEMGRSILNRMRGVEKDDDSWFPLVSINITF